MNHVAGYRFVRGVAVSGPALRLTLDSPLHLAHDAAVNVSRLNPAPAGPVQQTSMEAGRDTLPGDRVAFLEAPGAGNFENRANIVIFDRLNNATREAAASASCRHCRSPPARTTTTRRGPQSRG